MWIGRRIQTTATSSECSPTHPLLYFFSFMGEKKSCWNAWSRLNWDRTRASAVRDRRLTAWAMVSPLPITITEVTPRSHNMDPEYCLLSEERNPVRETPQQILVFCTFGASHATGPAWGFIYVAIPSVHSGCPIFNQNLKFDNLP
jgi:hypothetical protein